MMICVLIGIVPAIHESEKGVWETIQGINHLNEGTPVTWFQMSSAYDHENLSGEEQDNGGSPGTSGAIVTDSILTSLVTAACEVSEENSFSVPSLVAESIATAIRNVHSIDVDCSVWATCPALIPLKPLAGYSDFLPLSELANTCCNVKDAFRALRQWGVFVHNKVLSQDQVHSLGVIIEQKIQRTHDDLKTYQPHIKVGVDAFHFKEICSRQVERFDLRLLDEEVKNIVESYLFSSAFIRDLILEALGGPEEVDFDLSIVYSRPGATHQGWHADGSHQNGGSDAGWDPSGWDASLSYAYAYCLFIPLIDLNDEVGFTQFWPGSHRSKDLTGFGKVAELAQATFDGICSAGDCIVYDYRLFHRGMPNSSSSILRPVLQVIFKKKWYVEKSNYGVKSIRGGI